jgi:hypothetical protein
VGEEGNSKVRWSLAETLGRGPDSVTRFTEAASHSSEGRDGGGGSAGHFGVRESTRSFSELQNECADGEGRGEMPRNCAASGGGRVYLSLDYTCRETERVRGPISRPFLPACGPGRAGPLPSQSVSSFPFPSHHHPVVCLPPSHCQFPPPQK